MAGKYSNETAEQFAGRLFETVNGGYTTLAIAFGVKSGLFDVLVDHHETPKTSEELADLAGMKERYVREWLGAVTCASIVDLDEATGKYHLPAHRIASLRDTQPSGLMAALSKGVPYLSDVFFPMLEAIKKDGPKGLPFDTSDVFEETEANYTSAWNENCLVQELIPSYPTLQMKLESGAKMLDVGCGHGLATRTLAKRFPNSTFIGLDIRQANIDIARKEASSLGLTNVEYVYGDATKLPADWTASFDYVLTFNVLHDTSRPDIIVDEIKRVVKADGFYSVIEFDMAADHATNRSAPHGPTMYTISLFHCLPFSYHFPDSYGLGTMWGSENVREFLQSKGFDVSTSVLKSINEMHFLCQKSSTYKLIM